MRNDYHFGPLLSFQKYYLLPTANANRINKNAHTHISLPKQPNKYTSYFENHNGYCCPALNERKRVWVNIHKIAFHSVVECFAVILASIYRRQQEKGYNASEREGVLCHTHYTHIGRVFAICYINKGKRKRKMNRKKKKRKKKFNSAFVCGWYEATITNTSHQHVYVPCVHKVGFLSFIIVLHTRTHTHTYTPTM